MKNVVVSVVGTQRDVYGSENSIQIEALGQYYRKNGVHYIMYQEDKSGDMAGTTTILKVYDDHVTLLRRGAVEQKQEFYVGEKRYSSYQTSYGRLELAVVTRVMDITFGVVSGAVNITYDLEVDGQWQSENTLLIGIREEQNSGH